jgi:hypothetical protein
MRTVASIASCDASVGWLEWVDGVGDLRPWAGCSIPCDKIKENGSGRCASARERKGDRNRAVVYYDGDGIVLERRQNCGPPVRNRSGLAAC